MKTGHYLGTIVLLSALMSVVSCSKDQSKKGGDEPVVIPEQEIEFLVIVEEQQQKFFSQSYEFTVAGKTVTCDLSKMTPVDNLDKYVSFKNNIENAVTVMKPTVVSYKVYKTSLGKIKKGESVVGKKESWTIKSDRPTQETVDLIKGSTLVVVGKEKTNASLCQISIHIGVYNDDSSLSSFISKIIKSFDLSYTY